MSITQCYSYLHFHVEDEGFNPLPAKGGKKEVKDSWEDEDSSATGIQIKGSWEDEDVAAPEPVKPKSGILFVFVLFSTVFVSLRTVVCCGCNKFILRDKTTYHLHIIIIYRTKKASSQTSSKEASTEAGTL